MTVLGPFSVGVAAALGSSCCDSLSDIVRCVHLLDLFIFGRVGRKMYVLVGREKRASVTALQSAIIWKIVPLLSLCSFADYLCRCNVAFESEALKRDIGLSDIQFGASASFFFLGYTVFQLPSNLILSRCSAMCWLPCLAIGW